MIYTLPLNLIICVIIHIIAFIVTACSGSSLLLEANKENPNYKSMEKSKTIFTISIIILFITFISALSIQTHYYSH